MTEFCIKLTNYHTYKDITGITIFHCRRHKSYQSFILLYWVAFHSISAVIFKCCNAMSIRCRTVIMIYTNKSVHKNDLGNTHKNTHKYR